MELFRSSRATLLLLTASAALAGSPASAMTFTLIDTGGAPVGSQARAGFEAAASFWSSVLTDNVNVTLDIGFTPLGPGILGQTGSSAAVIQASNVYSALGLDKKTALDNAAVANLNPLTTVGSGPFTGADQLSMRVNQGAANSNGYSDLATRIDSDGSANNVFLDVNTANMKALGFTTDGYGHPFAQPDGSITFSSTFGFDFNPANGIAPGAYDFVGVATHEIGHALGFVSGVDTYDYYTDPVAPSASPEGGLLDGYAVGSVLDLFRYDAAGQLDWSTSAANKYFSIDGGQTGFNGDANFALGYYNGDGAQASHWQSPLSPPFCSGFIGIMNPYFCNGVEGAVTSTDLAAMDAIGWDLNYNALANPNRSISTAEIWRAYMAGIPEPASWIEMIVGLGLVGGCMRRLRPSKVHYAAVPC